MNIETRSDGTRVKIGKTGRKTKLCIGSNNTCTKEARKAGMCLGCTNNTGRELFKNRTNGEYFTANGIRYVCVGDQFKKMCNGDNDTCMNKQISDGLCQGHQNGTVRTKKVFEEGETFTHNNIRYIFKNKQKRKLCNALDDTCGSLANNGGLCSKHTNSTKCKFSAKPCAKTGNNDGYCIIHMHNVERIPSNSKYHRKLKSALVALGVDYEEHKYIDVDDTYICFEIFIRDKSIVVEFDDIAINDNSDVKNKYCLDNKLTMVRVKLSDDIEEKLRQML